MKHRTIIYVVTCLVTIFITGNAARSWRASDYKAVIRAPGEIRLDKTKIVPISLDVTTPEGMPYFSEVEGPIELWAISGKFVKADGTSAYSPFTVPVARGRAEAVLSLEDYDSLPSPLIICVTRGTGDREVLGQAAVHIRYPERITLSTPALTASADGLSRPVVSVLIEDQFGQPLEDVVVTARFRSPREKRTLSGSTDVTGNASIELPASETEGYASGQLVTERLASPMFTVVYANSKTTMVPLREVAGKMGARLQWDATQHVAIVRDGDVQLTVRVGESVAQYNGNPVPLAVPAQLTEGRVWVPLLFMREVAGYKG